MIMLTKCDNFLERGRREGGGLDHPSPLISSPPPPPYTSSSVHRSNGVDKTYDMRTDATLRLQFSYLLDLFLKGSKTSTSSSTKNNLNNIAICLRLPLACVTLHLAAPCPYWTTSSILPAVVSTPVQQPVDQGSFASHPHHPRHH